jgi:O-acetylserine/cysteine efflux transporter
MRLHWALITLIGASVNVGVNMGYKYTGADVGVVPVACAVMGFTALFTALYAVITRQPGLRLLLIGSRPLIVVALGFALSGVYALFFTALQSGPISLVDPLWACVYSLTSIALGMIIIRERPKPLALAGIALYLVGAGCMGYGQGASAGQLGGWVALVLVGGFLNALMNYGFKRVTQNINIPWAIVLSFAASALSFALYGLLTGVSSFGLLLTAQPMTIALAMGLASVLQVIFFLTALRNGPLSLVDPLWACVYALGSVAVGMLIAAEQPSPVSLLGVGLYLLGVILMANEAWQRSKITSAQG